MTTFFCKPHHRKSSHHQGQGHMVKMQPSRVSLTMPPHGVPIFDTATDPHHQHSTTNASSFSWPGQMLSRVTSMFRSPPTVQWVNRHLVVSDDPHHYNSGIMGPVAFRSPEEGSLWHAAPPGGIDKQMITTDPQNILSQNLLPKKQDSMNTNTTFHKSTKTLNPYAQEWVPKDYISPTTTSTNVTNGYILPTARKTSITVPPTPTVPPQSPVIASTTDTNSGESLIQEPICTSESPQNSKIMSSTNSSSLENQNLSSHRSSRNQSHSNIVDGVTFSPENLQSTSERPVLITETCEGSKHSMKHIPEKLLCHENISENQEFTPSDLINPKNIPENMEKNLKNSQKYSDITLESFEFIPNCLTNQKNVSESKKHNPTTIQQNHKDTLKNNINNNNNNNKGINLESFQSDKNTIKINKQNSKEVFTSEGQSSKPTMPECQRIASSPPIRPLSYAGVLGRMSPPPPSQTSEVKNKETQQPLPKIFQRNKPIQRDELIQVKEEGRRTCNLFKKPNKTQRTQSRKFLKELKTRSDGACCSSSTSLPTNSNSFVSSSLCPSKLTFISTPAIPIPNVCHSPTSPSSSEFASSSLITSSPCISKLNHMSPETTSKHVSRATLESPVPIPTTPPSPNHILSPTHEPSHHVRSSSESSSASIDIEFVEKDEVDRVFQVSPTSMKNLTQPPKGTKNVFLSCILGSVDSETEEESSDDESDWDKVCEDSKTDLDDSWETFGFGLVVVAHPMLTMPNQQCQSQYKQPNCQEKDEGILDINERWEKEVKKDVRGKSEPRVRFGNVKVHQMVVWDHAYRQARHGPWEQHARDRVRFAERVENMEPILAKILNPEHRQRVYNKLNNDCIS